MGRGAIADYKIDIPALENLLAFSARNFSSQYQYIAKQNQAHAD
jgi:hypothetical protein